MNDTDMHAITADTFERAAELIDTYGWLQGKYHNGWDGSQRVIAPIGAAA